MTGAFSNFLQGYIWWGRCDGGCFTRFSRGRYVGVDLSFFGVGMSEPQDTCDGG